MSDDALLTFIGSTLLLLLVVLVTSVLPGILDRHSLDAGEALVRVISMQSDADGIGDMDAVRFAALPLVPERFQCK